MEPQSIIAYVNDPVNVTCVTTGNPRPFRKWLLNGQDILELAYNFKIYRNTLYIASVSRDLTDSAITCEAYNDDGQVARSSAQLVVKYRYDGLNSLAAQLVVLENGGLGNHAKFHCNHSVYINLFVFIGNLLSSTTTTTTTI